jgi:RNA polymerase sigma-70 factor (ECF subfamily)
MIVDAIFGLRQRRAFRKMVGKSRKRLYRMAYTWTHDPYLADDMVQQALCKALNNQRQLKDIAAADAWLFRILANCLKDHYRAKREVLLGDDQVRVDYVTPETQTQEQQLVDEVRLAVSRLPLAQCQVITLVDLEGFTYAKVAETLEIPVGTVMSRLCRGRAALRDTLLSARSQLPTEQAGTITRIRQLRDNNG